jgi:hypothetical protein
MPFRLPFLRLGVLKGICDLVLSSVGWGTISLLKGLTELRQIPIVLLKMSRCEGFRRVWLVVS